MINRKNGFITFRSVPAKIVTIVMSLVFMGCSVLGNSDSDDNALTLAAAFALLANQEFDCTDDGLVWTESTTPQNGGWQGLTYGNGLFVTVGNVGTDRVATSTDGQTWTMRSDAGADGQWETVSYSNGRYIAANLDGGGADSQQIMTSTDAINWSRVSETSNGYFFRSATDNAGKFVVVPLTANNPANELLVSSGGLSWSPVTTPFANNESHGNVNYGNGIFLIFNQTTKTESITSTDGTTWSSVHTVPSAVWQDAVYGNGRFVAVGQPSPSASLMYSTNGIDGWTTVTDPASGKNWISVAYGGGLFVALNTNISPAISISTDGINWTVVSGLTTTTWAEIAYGNGKFVAVADTGKTMVSACD